MAKHEYESRDLSFPNQKIVNINLEHEMENAYIEYAMSVIVGCLKNPNTIPRRSGIPIKRSWNLLWSPRWRNPISSTP